MVEIAVSAENPKIPASWNFPERDDPRLKVVQLDLDEKFISFNLPGIKPLYSKSTEHKYFIHHSGDYFFGHDGNPLASREQHAHETIILLTGDSYNMYNISDDYYSQRVFVDFLLSAPTDEDLVPYSLGTIEYYNGDLYRLTLGEAFTTTNDEDTLIKSPFIRLEPTTRWALYEASSMGEAIDVSIQKNSNLRIQGNEGRNESRVFEANKEEIFRIKFQIEKEEVGEKKNMVKFLVVSQTHVPTGIEKILKAPLSVDRRRCINVANSKPSYQKEAKAGKNRLVVSWRDIDRIVDARLGYSRPPPQKP